MSTSFVLPQTPLSYPLQLPLTQGKSWYFFPKMESDLALPLFIVEVRRSREEVC